MCFVFGTYWGVPSTLPRFPWQTHPQRVSTLQCRARAQVRKSLGTSLLETASEDLDTLHGAMDAATLGTATGPCAQFRRRQRHGNVAECPILECGFDAEVPRRTR